MKHGQKSRIAIFTLIWVFIAASGISRAGKPGRIQEEDATVKKEITAALETWNDAAKSRDLMRFMGLFDNSESIMLVGSDSGEVFKGKEQIEGWAKKLVNYASFSWDMQKIDIDHNGNTAWIFMDGFMIVTNDKGKTSKFPYRFTGILVKVKGTWKWRLFDGSAPRGH